MDSNLNNGNDQWELSLDIDDFDLRLTLVLPKLLKERDILHGLDGAVMSTQEYMKKVVEDVGEDEDFKSGLLVSATDYVNANGGTVTKLLKERDILHGLDGAVMSTQEYMKKVAEDVGEDEDFKSGLLVSATDYVNANGGTHTCSNIPLAQNPVKIIPGPTGLVQAAKLLKERDILHGLDGADGYGKDITVGAALILANVSFFPPKPSMHYLNITKRNVVKVFGKDTVPESGSG
nr:hypothetical protein [Tanacetum cinerariifolium]